MFTYHIGDQRSSKNQTSNPTGWLRMRVWRMLLLRTKGTIISWDGSSLLSPWLVDDFSYSWNMQRTKISGIGFGHSHLIGYSLKIKHTSRATIEMFRYDWHILTDRYTVMIKLKILCPLFKHLSAGLRNSQDTVHFLKVKLLWAIAQCDSRFVGFLKYWKVRIAFSIRILSLNEGSKLVVS